MATFKRVRRAVYVVLGCLILVIAITWGALYAYARVYQRRASALIQETLALRPGSSTFADAKRIVDRYAKYQTASAEYETHLISSPCTPARCDFEIRMENWFEHTALFRRISYWDPQWKAWLGRLARTAGLRPVITYCHIEVRDRAVARTHAGYGFRSNVGGLVGVGIIAVKAFTPSDRCRMLGTQGEVEVQYSNLITAGGGAGLLIAYPMTAREDLRKRASQINVSCMTSVPECPRAEWSILPISEQRNENADRSERTPELLKKCSSMSDAELSRYAFGSID